ncbi:MAG: FAD-dependent oxidoreductase [Marinifilaceae bacterium]
MKKYDAIIIGYGKGGRALAASLALKGQSVAIIERSDKMYGGTSINTGCIPSKTLIHLAQDSRKRNESSFREKRKCYKRAIDRKDEIVSLLRERSFNKLNNMDSVRVYTGVASFINDKMVEITFPTGAKDSIESNLIFIDTGAENVIPDIPGAKLDKVYTYETMMELRDLPEELVIIGGSYLGLEFASMYMSFGSAVTVLDSNAVFLPGEDRDIADAVLQVMEGRGINFKFGVTINSIEEKRSGLEVHFQDKDKAVCLGTEAVLLATGRKPCTKDLNLPNAGIDVDLNGAIKVDSQLRTSMPHIFAMGDVKGGPQYTNISMDDHRIISNALHHGTQRVTSDRLPISYSIFIDPPLSRIGISEEDAQKQALDVSVKKILVSLVACAHTMDEPVGIMKSIVDNQTGLVLGCTLFCPNSREMINTVALAMKAGVKASVLRNLIYIYPSMSEVFNDLF